MNGRVFTMGGGGNTTTVPYGDMDMYDANDDGLITTNVNTPSTGDRLIINGTNYVLNELGIFNASTYTYVGEGGVVKTYVARVVVYQLANGNLVVRMRDDDRDAAPADFRFQNVTSVQLGSWDGTRYSSTVVSNFDAFPPNLCFCRGTLIETEHGPVAIESLRPGDLVRTRDNGLQPVRWIGSTLVSAASLAANPKLRPIRIDRGALGADMPSTPLMVSPQHRVVISSQIAQRMFGTDEVLVAAKSLLGAAGIEVAEDVPEAEYFHMLFDRHEIVCSNGAVTESLYTGPEALRCIDPDALEEIMALFPELRLAVETPAAARPMPAGRQARRLVARHVENRKPLFGDAPRVWA
ncbi:Hint domain-containing protein [Pseudogemmobacter blasticus]|uniref:Hedgehog/Intein (Hint) domain-containing protein n=1 Tax=Fuscovulum blasticum DSM 2131 TaxID=1188250 RepID=A0A2T4J827_FUSBL|nr:Hint domain-containing protein [Fuscovulum blasticum]PTE14060.1 hypothetical protein C5F44_10470 [Fuscovulum blasticum DSM 2131]